MTGVVAPAHSAAGSVAQVIDGPVRSTDRDVRIAGCRSRSSVRRPTSQRDRRPPESVGTEGTLGQGERRDRLLGWPSRSRRSRGTSSPRWRVAGSHAATGSPPVPPLARSHTRTNSSAESNISPRYGSGEPDSAPDRRRDRAARPMLREAIDVEIEALCRRSPACRTCRNPAHRCRRGRTDSVRRFPVRYSGAHSLITVPHPSGAEARAEYGRQRR